MLLGGQRGENFRPKLHPRGVTHKIGEVVSTADGRVRVQWSDGLVELLEVHPADPKRCPAPPGSRVEGFRLKTDST